MPGKSSRHTLLIVDDDPFCREVLFELLQPRGYNVLTAANGREALLALHRERIDLMILDVVMPEKSGLQLLEAVRGEARYRTLPVLLLSESADREVIHRAAQLRHCEYLLKRQFRVKNLVERIRRHLESRGTTPARSCETAANPSLVIVPRLSADQTLERIHEQAKARTLPMVLAEVLRIAGSPAAERADLVAVLMRDPVLSARVLEAANTAATNAGRRPVLTLMDAVAAVGFATIRNTAVTVGVFDAFTGRAADQQTIVRLWQHSFAVAAIMDRIVPSDDSDAAGIHHLVGLCHDLGDIMLQQLFPEQFGAVIGEAERMEHSFDVGLHDYLGLHHARLQEEVLAHIELPSQILKPIREFHSSGHSAHVSSMSRMARALRIADLCAAGLQFAATPNARLTPITKRECRDSLGTDTPYLSDLEHLRSEVLILTQHLVGGRVTGVDRLVTPLALKRVWYARHTAYSTLDPLEMTLSSMTSLHVASALPTSAFDLEGFDAVVTASPHAAAGFLAADLLNCAKLRNLATPVLALADTPTPSAENAKGITWMRTPVTVQELYEALRAIADKTPRFEGVYT